MLPGSHHQGRREHQLMNDDSNVLLSSQTIPDVDESLARAIPLQPGEDRYQHFKADLPAQTDFDAVAWDSQQALRGV